MGEYTRKIIVLLTCVPLLLLVGCSTIYRVISNNSSLTSVTIEGITYMSGFYGELYPIFGQVGDIGSETLIKDKEYDVGTHSFRRVDYEGHDWVHSYIGKYSGGTVYCAENEWDQMYDYYADSNNFDYYFGIGYYMSENVWNISDIDSQKFDELLTFGNINEYKPFDSRSNEKVMENICRIPKAEFLESVCFYKVSHDGYFTTIQAPRYFVHDDKLLMIFFHDGGRESGGIEEVVALEVPDELGEYFINLIEQYIQ